MFQRKLFDGLKGLINNTFLTIDEKRNRLKNQSNICLVFPSEEFVHCFVLRKYSVIQFSFSSRQFLFRRNNMLIFRHRNQSYCRIFAYSRNKTNKFSLKSQKE